MASCFLKPQSPQKLLRKQQVGRSKLTISTDMSLKSPRDNSSLFFPGRGGPGLVTFDLKIRLFSRALGGKLADFSHLCPLGLTMVAQDARNLRWAAPCRQGWAPGSFTAAVSQARARAFDHELQGRISFTGPNSGPRQSHEGVSSTHKLLAGVLVPVAQPEIGKTELLAPQRSPGGGDHIGNGKKRQIFISGKPLLHNLKTY